MIGIYEIGVYMRGPRLMEITIYVGNPLFGDMSSSFPIKKNSMDIATSKRGKGSASTHCEVVGHNVCLHCLGGSWGQNGS